MSRPRTGTVRQWRTSRGTSFGAQVLFKGDRVRLRFGGSWEGWTRERAEQELAYVIEQIRRGEWIPPQNDDPTPAQRERWRFRDLAAVVLARQATRLAGGADGKTYKDWKWRLSVAVDYLGDLELEQIDASHLDEMVLALLRERDRIEQAAARGEPEMESYVDSRTGKEHRRQARGLSRSSINKVVDGVERVLRDAKRRKLIERVPDTHDVRVKADRPRRPFLELGQAHELIDAACAIEEKYRGLSWDDVHAIRESDASGLALAREYGVSDTLIRKIRRREVWTHEATRRRNDIPRVALVKTLLLAGIRISELCQMDREHVDLPGARLHVPRIKTDASERVVPLVPALYETLLEHLASTPGGPKDPLFLNRRGGRQTPDNVRARILNPAGEAVSIRVTPHMLRRTFASILAEVGIPPRRAMYLLGHTNPTLTMAVYQQVLDVSAETEKEIETLLGCSLDEAFSVLAGRGVLVMNRSKAAEMPRRPSLQDR